MGNLEVIAQLHDAEKRISDALLAASSEKGGWDPSQPWATLLAIRVGIVVLLLYLSTILLATYRYTYTLAAYYLARADALQLLSHRSADRPFDINEFNSLVPLLSPDTYRIDKDSVPYESLGQITGTRTRV